MDDYSISNNPALEFSDVTNLLEQSDYKYTLQDRDEPNLYRYL